MRYFGMASAVLVCALAGLAQPVSSAAASSAGQQRVALVLFDLSRSTESASVRAEYLRDFASVLGYFSEKGGVVFGGVIDSNPLAQSGSLSIRASFSSCHFPANPLTCRNRARSTIIGVLALADRLLSQETARRGTAILDALNLSENVFDTYASAREKYLVVLSDGVEESSRYRFTDANLRPAAIRRFIARERSTHVLPTLDGVEVYFAGAAATATQNLPRPKILQIRLFWLTYFAATGADLPQARYGPTLISFP